MSILETKHEILKIFADQLGINIKMNALLGLLASRIDAAGEDEELKTAFDELRKESALFEDRLTISVKKLAAEVSREQT